MSHQKQNRFNLWMNTYYIYYSFAISKKNLQQNWFCKNICKLKKLFSTNYK